MMTITAHCGLFFDDREYFCSGETLFQKKTDRPLAPTLPPPEVGGAYDAPGLPELRFLGTGKYALWQSGHVIGGSEVCIVHQNHADLKSSKSSSKPLGRHVTPNDFIRTIFFNSCRKVRKAGMGRVPYVVVVGDEEVASKNLTVTVRKISQPGKLSSEQMTSDSLIAAVRKDVEGKAAIVLEAVFEKAVESRIDPVSVQKVFDTLIAMSEDRQRECSGDGNLP
jgi:Anticodon binding domain